MLGLQPDSAAGRTESRGFIQCIKLVKDQSLHPQNTHQMSLYCSPPPGMDDEKSGSEAEQSCYLQSLPPSQYPLLPPSPRGSTSAALYVLKKYPQPDKVLNSDNPCTVEGCRRNPASHQCSYSSRVKWIGRWNLSRCDATLQKIQTGDT